MKTAITGVIRGVKLIEVNELNLQFIYGTVERDHLGRWGPGNWMVRTGIERIDTENLLVYTQNSIYRVNALPSPISLSVEQFYMVRQGVSPSTFKEDP